MRMCGMLVAAAVTTVVRASLACEDIRISNLVHADGTKTTNSDRFGHVEKVGTGPVDMILIPAGGWGWQTYDSFMRRNAAKYTMFAVTLPGYGGTDPFEMPNDVRYDKLAWCGSIQRAIQALIDDRGLKEPVIVGQGLLGDYHAMRFGLDHPRAVSGVVVIAGSPLLGFAKPRASAEARAEHVHSSLVPLYANQTASQWRAGLMPPTMLSTDQDRAKELFTELSRVPRPTMLRYFLEVCTTDLSEELKTAQAPMLAVEALPSGLVAAPAAVREMLLEQIAWFALQKDGAPISVEFVSNSQRFIMDDQPKAFDAAIERFVATVRAR